MTTLPPFLAFSDEVRNALADGRPVVALESTVIAQGLPRPLNIETALGMEQVVREEGAVPATIAILSGTPHIGLTQNQIERIGRGEGVEKLSTRDLPSAMARGGDGSTTVAATAFLAHRAGIEVFATGGIGGVHRGSPIDISGDLAELARTAIVVVCAGAKSILDLPATREVLEALGILVIGFGTDFFPAFYAASSGLSVDARVENGGEVAEIWASHRQLGLESGILVCVPIPASAAIPAAQLDQAVESALAEAAAGDVRGKHITPFLLNRVGRATGGASIEGNVSLLLNNARVAAAVAVKISAR